MTRIESLRGRFDAIVKAVDSKSIARFRALLKTTEFSLGRFEEIDFNDDAYRIVDVAFTDKKLKKVGRCDLLIACICLAHDATLVTRNLKDFKLVPGLKIENWAD